MLRPFESLTYFLYLIRVILKAQNYMIITLRRKIYFKIKYALNLYLNQQKLFLLDYLDIIISSSSLIWQKKSPNSKGGESV